MPPDNITLDQLTETRLLEFPKGHFLIRCAYSRSAECQQADHEGQDYLVFRADPRKFVFALCDGVSGSFFGDLAAKRVGDKLINWLWALPSIDPPEVNSDYVNNLEVFLNGIAPQIQKEVDLLDIKWVDPPALIPILDKKRINGSQTTMVCGVFYAPSQTLPKGRARFFWLGNSRLHIWSKGTDQSQLLNALWTDKNRWYSTKGVEGKIQSFVGDLSSIDSFVAHSDGFNHALLDVENEPKLIDNFHPGLPKNIIDETITTLQKLPKNDDVSYIEVEFKPSSFVQQTYITDQNEFGNRETIVIEKPGPIVYKERSLKEIFLSVWWKMLILIFLLIAVTLFLLVSSYRNGFSTATDLVKATANAQLSEELEFQATKIAKAQKPLPTQIPTAFLVPTQVPMATSIPHDFYPKLAPMLFTINPGETWQSLCYEKLHFLNNQDFGACSDLFVQDEIIKYIELTSNGKTLYENFKSNCEVMIDPLLCSLSYLKENKLYGFFPPSPTILLSGNALKKSNANEYIFFDSNNPEEVLNVTFDGIKDEDISFVIDGLNSGELSSVLLFGSYLPDDKVNFYPKVDYFMSNNLPIIISYIEGIDKQNKIIKFGRVNMLEDQGIWIYTRVSFLQSRLSSTIDMKKDISSFSPDSRILVYSKIQTTQDGLIAGLRTIDYWFYDWGEGGYRQYFP